MDSNSLAELMKNNPDLAARNPQVASIDSSVPPKRSKDPRVTFITGKLPWWIIVNYLYEAEGARDPKELQEVIDGIYGRHVPDDELFYVHFGDFKGEKA